MPRIVSVRLRHPGEFYDFDAGDLELSPGDWVIVNRSRGEDIGQVVLPCREIALEDIPGDLYTIVRLAHEGDLRKMERFQEKEAEVLARVQEKVDAAEMPMRLVGAEYSYNGRCLTIYFSAEQRVDFRKLVKQLAREFRTRIELRQIGARDEARLLGGIGTCGRELCCATWLQEFLRISVRMAKDQDLPLSPMKISGVCGRLLCCLSYECDQYRQIKAELPTVGDEVVTLHGKGRVVSLSVPREAVTVEIRAGLTVEASAQELAEARQLEAEGKLKPVPLAVAPFHIGPQEKAATPRKEEAPAAAAAASSKKSRRRRRRKKTAEDKPTTGKQPARPARTKDSSQPSSRRRRSPRQAGGGDQSRGEGQPKATPAKKDPSSSSSSRRRPRRRRPQEKGPS